MLENLYIKEREAYSRWASFENSMGLKGEGGKENNGAKGHAFERIEPGEAKTLLNVQGSGIINRIWMTVSDRTEATLRSLKLEIFWDNSDKPAVSMPLGDFFCAALGIPVAFESYLFSNPEGRSFNSFIQMPFWAGARVVITNESSSKLKHLFYDINYTLKPIDKANMLYFHSYWNRENNTVLCRDYTILNSLSGEGRFLGLNIGVNTNKLYGKSWFGEGEMKFFIDGDKEFPTLCGTGIEDYIGTAWGQGKYTNMTQGCPVAEEEAGKYAFYRFHIFDPVYFHENIKVTIQNIGGASRDDLLEIVNRGAPCKIVSSDNNIDCLFEKLYEQDFVLTKKSREGWYNYYREDDFSSTAYFYYDKPYSDLPALCSVEERTAGTEY